MRHSVKNICAAVCVWISAATTVAQVTGSGTPGTVPVFTGSSTIGDSSAPLVVSSSGNVGIGTTPSAKLHVLGNSPIVEVQDVGPGYPGVGLYNSAGVYSNQLDGSNGTLYWYNGVTRTMVLQQNGYLGLGTPSPNAPLNISTGSIGANSQVNNAINIQPAGGEASWGNGVSIYFSSVTNTGVNPIAGIWGGLEDGGAGGMTYDGALVFGSVRKGSSVPSEGMRLNALGNVGIGTTSPGKPLDVSGTIRTSASGGDTGGVIYPDGTQQTTAWTGVLCGGDYAEAVDASGDRKHYGPGDVLVLGAGSDNDVEKSTEPYSTMVAGVFATKPGVIGRRETLPKSAQEIPMAMVGIVPTKVSAENGPIHKGDLLVTSSTAGYAMKGTDRSRLVGAVIGKAMGTTGSGTGVIDVLVTLQ